MKANYNRWFYESHEYLKNSGINGVVDYNDTKTINVGDRYKILNDLGSELFNTQPFGIISNRRGFDKLIELMEKSNYTFEDINDSLIETYKQSLTNAMSNMLVNTSAIMFKCSNTDTKYVSSDRYSRYYIIEAPFDQLHFGDRDEFIRQQLDKMHTNGNDLYVPLNEFVQSPYTDILGFTLMCCTNGRICNDCMVAIDDKGFKFKIYWPYDYKECVFVIYKFDVSKVYTTKISYESLYNNKSSIPFVCPTANGEKCIVNLYDANYSRTVPTVPNFGILNKDNLTLCNLQDYTMKEFESNGTKEISVTIYAIKYLQEVPNLYASANYYDIIDTRRVYTENGDVVCGVKHDKIYSSSVDEFNDLPKCTPPIVLDKYSGNSFGVIVDCLNLRDKMTSVYNTLRYVGNTVSGGNINNNTLITLKANMNQIQSTILPCYKTYIQGGILTSLVDSKRVNVFDTFVRNIREFIDNATVDNIAKYTDFNLFPELYGNGYLTFVDYVLKPFESDILKPFSDIFMKNMNYFTVDNSRRFNRPVSEQCFISMKYDRDDECWIFDVPKIEHFKGIGNAFYINEDLNGDEIFKFFVLYTDTENPVEFEVEPMKLEQVFDFDSFYTEASKHIGYIKYWNAENKLMKMSKILFNEYTVEKCVHILSKILKHKLDGCDDVLEQYPTLMNYEPSNASSLNWDKYNEYSDEAPFALNFMFYTLTMMNDNEDKLQSYLYRSLVKNKHSNRYADIDIGSMIDKSLMLPVDYSTLSITPFRIDTDNSSLPDENGLYAFYGLSMLSNNSGDMTIVAPYRYTFNVYENNTKYPIITENDCSDNEYYVSYENVYNYNSNNINYQYDINVARLLTRYLIASYDLISYLQTYYKHPMNELNDTLILGDRIDEILNDLSSYVSKYNNKFINPDTRNIVSGVFSENFSDKTYPIAGQISSIRSISFNGRTTSIENVTNEFIKTLQSVYKNTGFDDGVSKRVRNLYIHLKKINTIQNVYEFMKWVDEIDLEMIQSLDNMRSENEYSVYKGNNVFEPYANAFYDYIVTRNTSYKLRTLKTLIDGLYSTNYTTMIKPIVDYCEDIIEHWIFDYFIIDDIEFDKSLTYSSKPYTVTVDITAGDRFHPPVGQIIDVNSTLVFEPIIDEVNGGWIIKDISKICEYAFFMGTDLAVSMNVLSQEGNIIRTIDGNIKFFRIGSSADSMIPFNQYPNMKNTCIDIQNIHEEYFIDTTGNKDYIVNKKFGKMNYELLVGNNYCQLDHTSELILERKSMLPGSVDRIYVPGYVINRMSSHDFGQHISSGVYFKPSQVLHLPIENDEMISVGGKYFVGQTLWLITDDEIYIFPIIVTAVDMNESNGFVEAIVDTVNCKWLKLEDIEDIKKYFEQNIECTVIDDNISNFLDEYSNSNNGVYQIPQFPVTFDFNDEDNINEYSMPGDPIYVQTNSPYIYTRLNWIFNSDIENRYPDNEPQNHHMIYVGSTDSLDNTSDIEIKLINHSFEPFTDPENYPVLRTEPDDHFIWEEERRVFSDKYNNLENEYNKLRDDITSAWEEWYSTEPHTQSELEQFKLQIDSMEIQKNKVYKFMNRVKQYLTQLEYPTTWYNVIDYEAAKLYINNGRAPENLTHITNVRNIPFTDKLEVFIYDWENHVWLSPSTFSVELNTISSVKLGEYENYNTTQVMNSITITPLEGFPSSKMILIYFAYDKSDVFDDITINPKTCNVRFKPLLTIDQTYTDYDPYSKIFIRKQFDGHETYKFDEYSEIDNFNQNGYLFKRPNRNGKYTNSPNIRYCNMTCEYNGNDLSYEDFDLYVRLPFKDVTSDEKYYTSSYTASILKPIDGFVDDEKIKLICISNNSRSSYDGNISSVMFEGIVSTVNDNQTITITKSTLPGYASGTYTCTVFKDNTYPHSGGIISVTVTPTQHDVIDGNWIHIVENDIYHILPDEFVLVPHSPIIGDIKFIFNNEYIKEYDGNITTSDVDNINNPFLYYHDIENEIKYPIGNVDKNNFSDRLTIDQTTNPNIKISKNTFISVSRYTLKNIPKDGIIDMTGYLPTPLSRDHYEFWVNGRFLRDEVKIISPASVQLTNLKSLKNFECIELVDDYDSSNTLIPHGSVYIDTEGNSYASYKLAISSKNNITSQSIRYTFNGNNQELLQTYTKAIISNPNNKDIESDIMENIVGNDESNEVPSLNGVDIYYPYSHDLGIIETSNQKILEMFDKVWMLEQVTNPLFPMSHKKDNANTTILHSKYSTKDDMFIVYASGQCDKYFSLYISENSNSRIDNTSDTLKIIPFVRVGIYVYLDKSYSGKWLCSTNPNTKPIKIM